jgi:hypothetical protein
VSDPVKSALLALETEWIERAVAAEAKLARLHDEGLDEIVAKHIDPSTWHDFDESVKDPRRHPSLDATKTVREQFERRLAPSITTAKAVLATIIEHVEKGDG